jgi:peptide/nickel transport system ATP-binding protein
MAVMGLLPLIGGRISRGSIRFDGTELVGLAEPAYRALRGGRIALITQNPMTSLDPLRTVGWQVDQVGRLHDGLSAAQARARSIDLLQQLRIPDAATVHGQYPHQLSGGMKQRIVIAMALAGEPDLIIADEPTTALDVTIQAQIIQILVDLVRQRGLALMLITHDMGVVAQACDQVVVLYGGRVAESKPPWRPPCAPGAPLHPRAHRLHRRAGQAARQLKGIPGVVPSVADHAAGCRYHPRCDMRQAAVPAPPCRVAGRSGPGNGRVACHFPLEPGPWLTAPTPWHQVRGLTRLTLQQPPRPVRPRAHDDGGGRRRPGRAARPGHRRGGRIGLRQVHAGAAGAAAAAGRQRPGAASTAPTWPRCRRPNCAGCAGACSSCSRTRTRRSTRATPCATRCCEPFAGAGPGGRAGGPAVSTS